MKKLLLILIVFSLIFSLTSCFESEEHVQEAADLFASFEHNTNYVLLTHFELVISDKHYDRSEILYNGKLSNIVFLEQDGFYSYTYDEETFYVEFLYTTYENFETEAIGSLRLPDKLVGVTWARGIYWLTVDDPTTDKFKRIYYCWDVETKSSDIKQDFFIPEQHYLYDSDNFRSEDYTILYDPKFFSLDDDLEITHNASGLTKKITKSTLDSFAEGKLIKACKSTTTFYPDQVYIVGDDFYIACVFGVESWTTRYYCYYIFKWNFNTEESSFFTAVHFDDYQEWIDDMIILKQD